MLVAPFVTPSSTWRTDLRPGGQNTGVAEERLSPERISKLAGRAAFTRGVLYQRQGRVENVLRTGSTVKAMVRGTIPYRVTLGLGTNPTWSCTCPVGIEEKFCKHCAAVAMELVGPEQPLPPADPEPRLADSLTSLSRAQLEEIVRLAAARDLRVAQAVQTAAAAASGGPLDLDIWAKRVDTAFRTGGFVPYNRASEWASGVAEVLDALADLIDAGYASEVLQLAQRAHRKLDLSIRRVDDSGGEGVYLSGLIADLHHRAAIAAAPEPVAFARTLAKLELGVDLDTFRRSAQQYSDVLGDKGLRAFRRAVEPKWRKATEQGGDSWSRDRYITTEAMIGVVLAGGNPDELVEVMGPDMRRPDDYLEVARAMEAAGRRGEAIRWSRRGLSSLGNRYWMTHALREFLASLYADDGDDEAAGQLWWDEFTDHPSVESYRRLVAEVRTADPADTGRRAVAALRARVALAEDDSRLEAAAASRLVEILLYEGLVEEGWTEALTHGVDEKVWLKLAVAREADHPLDVIPVYEQAAEARIATKKPKGYEEAVQFLKRIEKLGSDGGEPLYFPNVLARLVQQHQNKPTLMAMLQRAGWV